MSRTYVTSLCFSPDDSSLAVVYADGSLVCYDTSTWGKRWVAGPRKPDGTYRASFDATGALVRARTAAQGPIPHFVADAASGTPVAQGKSGGRRVGKREEGGKGEGGGEGRGAD